MDDAVESLVRVDEFLAGVLSEIDSETTLLITSDHGNLEVVGAGHTRNPVLGVATGPGAEAASGLRDLREVTDFTLDLLGVEI